jgi:hypothetical protein
MTRFATLSRGPNLACRDVGRFLAGRIPASIDA